ncbi:hypothetical protein PYW07_015615 [Mythimna separata]|uniref:Uncharacterized protein n=1 Tax=Mythimna separata TaxID=271217 RepID=A0AAD7YZA9_MYTSE|nr:hypothetical protein PYW07_015615 [Mythimna separata]
MNGTPARRPKSAFSEMGVRIKEVSEGRPCDNCPELCPGFIPHAWRRITGTDKEPVKEKKIQKFPSRERNFAVKRKFNNNMRSHANCESCARVAEKENR